MVLLNGNINNNLGKNNTMGIGEIEIVAYTRGQSSHIFCFA